MSEAATVRTVGGTPSRRALVRGAAWTVPVVAFASAAPTASASQPCVPTTVQLNPSTSSTNPLVLTSVGPNGEIYTVTISSTASANTAKGQTDTSGTFVDYNFTQNQQGWRGSNVNSQASDVKVSGFGEPGAIVLNQRARATSTAPGSTPLPGAVSQTLTFSFAKDGVPFDPTNLSLTVFDISSAGNGTIWRSTYWDAVGFSVAPSAIVSATNPGTGTGTTADPFHRATGTEGTGSSPVPFSDQFTFDAFPSGSQMVYSQNAGRQGWQFISISAISFTEETCV